jgi:hypothetical protein
MVVGCSSASGVDEGELVCVGFAEGDVVAVCVVSEDSVGVALGEGDAVDAGVDVVGDGVGVCCWVGVGVAMGDGAGVGVIVGVGVWVGVRVDVGVGVDVGIVSVMLTWVMLLPPDPSMIKPSEPTMTSLGAGSELEGRLLPLTWYAKITTTCKV